MMRITSFIVAAMMWLPLSASASDYLNIYSGFYDVSQEDDQATLVGLEYRYEDVFYGLRPGAGVMVTTDEAVYGYGGFFWDLYLTDSLVFTPNVVAGAYTQGEGKDLGHGLEFRSGLELSYQFPRGNRLGVAFNHLSNASIGNDNPGTETLLVIYQHPLNLFADTPKKDRWWR